MLENVSKGITTLNRKAGEISSLLMIPLLAVVVYEVFMRYAFNAPTIWGFEVTGFLYGLHYMLGYSYCDCLNGHVRIDVMTMRMKPKTKAVMEVITLIILFFPFLTLMTVFAGKFSYIATTQLELNSTSWAPPIWPIKILMTFGFFLLWLQGIANLINNINIVFGKTADAKQEG